MHQTVQILVAQAPPLKILHSTANSISRPAADQDTWARLRRWKKVDNNGKYGRQFLPTNVVVLAAVLLLPPVEIRSGCFSFATSNLRPPKLRPSATSTRRWLLRTHSDWKLLVADWTTKWFRLTMACSINALFCRCRWRAQQNNLNSPQLRLEHSRSSPNEWDSGSPELLTVCYNVRIVKFSDSIVP